MRNTNELGMVLGAFFILFPFLYGHGHYWQTSPGNAYWNTGWWYTEALLLELTFLVLAFLVVMPPLLLGLGVYAWVHRHQLFGTSQPILDSEETKIS